MFSYGTQLRRKRDLPQDMAVFESIVRDFCKPGRKSCPDKFNAIFKSPCSQAGQTAGKFHGLEKKAAPEGVSPDFQKAVREDDPVDGFISVKGLFGDDRDPVGNSHSGLAAKVF